MIQSSARCTRLRARARSTCYPKRTLSNPQRPLRFFARILAGLALVAAAGNVSAARSVQLDVDAVLGEHVTLGPPSQARTTVVFFMSRKAESESTAFGRDIDERLLDAAIESVAIVDMHPYAGWLRRLATSRLKKSAEEARVHRRERRVARGIDASNDVINRWHLIGDFDGALFSRFGVAADLAHPIAFVLDKSGTVLGPFHDVPAVAAAVGQATRAR